MNVRIALLVLRLLDPHMIRRRARLLALSGGIGALVTGWLWIRSVSLAPRARAEAYIAYQARRAELRRQRAEREHARIRSAQEAVLRDSQ